MRGTEIARSAVCASCSSKLFALFPEPTCPARRATLPYGTPAPSTQGTGLSLAVEYLHLHWCSCQLPVDRDLRRGPRGFCGGHKLDPTRRAEQSCYPRDKHKHRALQRHFNRRRRTAAEDLCAGLSRGQRTVQEVILQSKPESEGARQGRLRSDSQSEPRAGPRWCSFAVTLSLTVLTVDYHRHCMECCRRR